MNPRHALAVGALAAVVIALAAVLALASLPLGPDPADPGARHVTEVAASERAAGSASSAPDARHVTEGEPASKVGASTSPPPPPPPPQLAIASPNPPPRVGAVRRAAERHSHVRPCPPREGRRDGGGRRDRGVSA